jgi:hypothetical protein
MPVGFMLFKGLDLHIRVSIKQGSPVGRSRSTCRRVRVCACVCVCACMCLSMHTQEVTALLEAYPETPVVIDHWGFFHQDGWVCVRVATSHGPALSSHPS